MSEFDLILYLTNRRLRDQKIILKKYSIIEKIIKSDYSEAGKIDITLLEQLKSFLRNGPY